MPYEINLQKRTITHKKKTIEHPKLSDIKQTKNNIQFKKSPFNYYSFFFCK